MINSVTLSGTLGKDPEFKTGACNFSIATNEKYKDKQGVEHKKTVWHYCVCFGPTAESFVNSARKGDTIVVSGKLSGSTYKTAHGEEKKSYGVYVITFMVVPKKPKTETADNFGNTYDSQFIDDDIPF